MNIKEIDWKTRFQMTPKSWLVMVGLILAVAGWFLLGVILIGRLEIEEFLQTTALAWSFRILIIGTASILFIKRGWLPGALEDRRFKGILYILYGFYGVGFIGWVWGIADLLA